MNELAEAAIANVPAEPLPPEPVDVARAILEIVSPLSSAVAWALLAALPLPGAYGLCAAGFVAVAALERLRGARSRDDILYAACFALLFALAAADVSIPLKPGGMIFLSVLILARTPALLSGAGSELKWSGRRRVALYSFCLHIVALFAAPLAQDAARFAAACSSASLVGWLAMLVVAYRGLLVKEERQTLFRQGDFVFRQIGHDADSIKAFIRPYAGEMAADIERGRVRIQGSALSIEEIFARYDSSELSKSGPQHVRFLAFQGEQVAGGMSVALDRPGERLPDEQACDLDFDLLRRRGRVMEAGLVYIRQDFRFQQDVFIGLFKCVLELAIENDVSFIMISAIDAAKPIFEKLGFRSLELDGISNPAQCGAETRLLALNFLSVVMCRGTGTGGGTAIRDSLNRGLLERYVIRAILRRGWLPRRWQGWHLSIEEMRRLCRQPSLTPATRGAP